ncbi:MAG: hypothetical protein CMJ51_03745 [Planctomycetaceae bacterium]|nr:hypothetical protein [Planctomycetaceae bacterium]
MTDIHELMKRVEAVVSAALADAPASDDFDPASISDQAKRGVGQVLASLEDYLDTIPDRETAIKVGNEIAAFLGEVVFSGDVFSDLDDDDEEDWGESDDDDLPI